MPGRRLGGLGFSRPPPEREPGRGQDDGKRRRYALPDALNAKLIEWGWEGEELALICDSRLGLTAESVRRLTLPELDRLLVLQEALDDRDAWQRTEDAHAQAVADARARMRHGSGRG